MLLTNQFLLDAVRISGVMLHDIVAILHSNDFVCQFCADHDVPLMLPDSRAETWPYLQILRVDVNLKGRLNDSKNKFH